MDSRGISTLTVVVTVLICGLIAGGAHAATPYHFDQTGYLGEASLLPDWSATMQREHHQSDILDACVNDDDTCPAYYKGLRHLLLKAQALPPGHQIHLVNRYVNRKRYRNDRTAEIDTALANEPVKYRSRWATVEEFMRRGGDCEDYATTKYYLLRRLGFDIDQLRVIVVWDRQARGYHAILAVRHEGKIRLLESNNEIRRGARHPYRFIYSVNEKSIWDHQGRKTVSRKTHPTEDNPA